MVEPHYRDIEIRCNVCHVRRPLAQQAGQQLAGRGLWDSQLEHQQGDDNGKHPVAERYRPGCIRQLGCWQVGFSHCDLCCTQRSIGGCWSAACVASASSSRYLVTDSCGRRRGRTKCTSSGSRVTPPGPSSTKRSPPRDSTARSKRSTAFRIATSSSLVSQPVTRTPRSRSLLLVSAIARSSSSRRCGSSSSCSASYGSVSVRFDISPPGIGSD